MEPQTTAAADTSGKTLVERLFAAGAHFGFSKSRRHPTAMPYLFGSKQGTDIFDLEKTEALLRDGAAYLEQIGAAGGVMLLVGTKEEVKRSVRERAEALSLPYVTNRWIGGMLTNFSEIQKRIKRLVTLREQRESGELERKYTKKERLMMAREMEKLDFNFGGISAMEKLPAVLLIIDPRHDDIAVREARQLGIPVVAIMGSDCDARPVEKPVFVNDAHRSSVALALDELIAGYERGRAAYTPEAAPSR